jgi:FkbM family methyltransferase
MIQLLKYISARLPRRWQQGLKRGHYARQIARGQFDAGELEYALLPQLIGQGDWVIDVGANIGHYTMRMSDLVGANGRVIAFEPVPQTFELLAANTALLQQSNVTLINAAVSEAQSIAGMKVPVFSDTGLDDLYDAHLTDEGSLKVMCLSLDSLQLRNPIRFVKIDAEGHELSVLKGMAALIERDRPTLLVEGDDADVERLLGGMGYAWKQLPGSWNRIFSATPT